MKALNALVLALLFGFLPAHRPAAEVISWGFSGVLNRVDNNSNAIPAHISAGMPFSGFVSYDSSKSGSDSSPSPKSSAFYFHSDKDVSIKVYVGGIILSSTNRSPGSIFAGLGVNNNLSDRYDEFWIFAAGGGPLLNGAPLPVPATDGSIEISFQDYSKTAVDSDAYPTFIPGFPRFEQSIISVSAYTPGAENSVLYLDGEITATSLVPTFILTVTPLPGNQLRLSWPVSATGLKLQFATSLTPQNWKVEPTAVVDTATEHTVTVSTVGQPRYFRLVPF